MYDAVKTLPLSSGVAVFFVSTSYKKVFRINKISNSMGEDIYPPMYSKFILEETMVISDLLYERYLSLLSAYPSENIFLFCLSDFSSYYAEILSQCEHILKVQNNIKELERLEFISSQLSYFYEMLSDKFDFTDTEAYRLKNLLKYALLEEIELDIVCSNIISSLNYNRPKKLVRKDFLNALNKAISK